VNIPRTPSFFCEDCPARGNVVGEAVGIVYSEYYKGKRGLPSTKRRMGVVGAVVDNEMNTSEIIEIPFTWSEGRICEEIARCESPEYEERGVFKKRSVPSICPAIGKLLEKDPKLVDGAKRMIG
jgi:hypothetical protein